MKKHSPLQEICPDCGGRKSYRCKRCRSCAVKNRWKRGDNFHSIFIKGSAHPGWKGGKIKDSGGYIKIRKPEHPRAVNGYVLEHILVWEETHGKPLPEGWIIHHLNGIKNDNRPNNLKALPSKKHYLLLEAKAKRIQELEALLNNQHQLL